MGTPPHQNPPNIQLFIDLWRLFMAFFLQAEAVSFHVPKLSTAALRACEAWAPGLRAGRTAEGSGFTR